MNEEKEEVEDGENSGMEDKLDKKVQEIFQNTIIQEKEP